jgi:hypothetical protein
LLMAGQHTSAATGACAILRLGENQDLQWVTTYSWILHSRKTLEIDPSFRALSI